MTPLEALGAVARRHGLDTLLLREPATLAWLLGCRVHVPQTLDTACLDVVVTGLAPGGAPVVRVVTNAIEAPRLADTELPAGLPVELVVVPWWGERRAEWPTGPGVGTDRPWQGARDVAADVAGCRRVLTDDQAATLATVSADAAVATGRAALQVRAGLSEYEVAGILARELLRAELEPIVLLIAADGRDAAHRHPLPTPLRGEHSYLLVCCARRHGLVASVTRAVCFEGRGLDRAARDERHRAVLEVERAFLDATTPGRTLGEVVAAGTAAYADHGFAPEEWTRHHQGGLSGWVPREFPATPRSPEVLAAGMVAAWNPSGDGCKVEDTCLVTAGGPRPLVHDPEWPAVEVGGRTRPALLWR